MDTLAMVMGGCKNICDRGVATGRHSPEPGFPDATDMGASPVAGAATGESRSGLPPSIGGSRARFSKTAATIEGRAQARYRLRQV